jgi:hypothetical protein
VEPGTVVDIRKKCGTLIGIIWPSIIKSISSFLFGVCVSVLIVIINVQVSNPEKLQFSFFLRTVSNVGE